MSETGDGWRWLKNCKSLNCRDDVGKGEGDEDERVEDEARTAHSSPQSVEPAAVDGQTYG